LLTPDTPAVPLDNIFTDDEAKPPTAFLRRLRLWSTIKRLKNMFQLFFLHTLPEILYREPCCILLPHYTHLDRTPIRRVLDCITDQVGTNLAQSLAIGLQHHGVSGNSTSITRPVKTHCSSTTLRP